MQIWRNKNRETPLPALRDMKLLGALKDRSSILSSRISRKTAYHNPDIEKAVIKATSHDSDTIDYKNVQRIFQWLSTSPSYSKPLLTAISRRMDRTKSWAVALKGLMLMHGVFWRNVHGMGMLPFDLSDFADGHSGLSKAWCLNAFVRSYFSFLDRKSAFAGREWSHGMKEPVANQLLRLDELQTLLDKLLRVKPLTWEILRFSLVVEAMDCIIIEIFQTYGTICQGVARVLINSYESGRLEAAMTLRILKRATAQGHKLREYFEFCSKYGVLSAGKFPKVVEIPKEDVKELERIINRIPEKKIIEMEVERKDEDSKTRRSGTSLMNNGGIVDQQCGKENVAMLVLAGSDHILVSSSRLQPEDIRLY